MEEIRFKILYHMLRQVDVDGLGFEVWQCAKLECALFEEQFVGVVSLRSSPV
jgi:hypothetical protein